MTPDKLTRRRLLGAGCGILAAGGLGGSASADRSTCPSTVARSRLQDDEQGTDGTYAEVYQETIDDVVLVNVFGADGEGSGGLGSGFVIDDGYVVTNDHVVMGASEAELQFRDEQWRTASVVGRDVHSDLAVLDVEDLPDGSTGLSFTQNEPVIGQEVLALGNPLGLDASISQGIVSGIDRSLPSPTGFAIPAAIQTDAPVNPGNSGGPLVNLDGDVLGVVFAGAGQTIGFAISARLADRVIPALVDDGEYHHPYLGVRVQPVSPLIAAQNDLEESRGVLVVDTPADAPAEDVLRPADDVTMVEGAPVPVGGDVIVAIGDEEIPNQDRLSAVLALETSPDESIDVEVIRDGQRETVSVTLARRPEAGQP